MHAWPQARQFHEAFIGDHGTGEQLGGPGFPAQGVAQDTLLGFLRKIAGADDDVAQTLLLLFDGFTLFAEGPPALVIHQAQFPALFRETQIGIVLAQEQAVFGPGGEHAIRLLGAQGDEVIHQHAQVGLVPARTPA